MPASRPALDRLVRQEEQRVEHNRLGQSDRQNSMDDHRGEGTGVAANRRGHAQAGQADSDADAERGEANVNASSQFCE